MIGEFQVVWIVHKLVWDNLIAHVNVDNPSFPPPHFMLTKDSQMVKCLSTNRRGLSILTHNEYIFPPILPRVNSNLSRPTCIPCGDYIMAHVKMK